MIEHMIRHPIRFSLSSIKIFCAGHLFVDHVLNVGPTNGPSMLPTISVTGDWIATDKTHARNHRGALEVGDLVTYYIPIKDHCMGLKRIMGMPGDYVSRGTPGEEGDDVMIQIPEGHCWVLGDNLSASRDSRDFGPLPLALILGKPVMRILPLSERGWFHNTLRPVEGQSTP